MTDESLRDASRRNAQSSRPPRSMMSSTAAALKPKPDCICRCSIRFLQPCGNVYIISYFQPKRAPNSRMAQYIPYSAICRLGDTQETSSAYILCRTAPNQLRRKQYLPRREVAKQMNNFTPVEIRLNRICLLQLVQYQKLTGHSVCDKSVNDIGLVRITNNRLLPLHEQHRQIRSLD